MSSFEALSAAVKAWMQNKRPELLESIVSFVSTAAVANQWRPHVISAFLSCVRDQCVTIADLAQFVLRVQTADCVFLSECFAAASGAEDAVRLVLLCEELCSEAPLLRWIDALETQLARAVNAQSNALFATLCDTVMKSGSSCRLMCSLLLQRSDDGLARPLLLSCLAGCAGAQQLAQLPPLVVSDAVIEQLSAHCCLNGLIRCGQNDVACSALHRILSLVRQTDQDTDNASHLRDAADALAARTERLQLSEARAKALLGFMIEDPTLPPRLVPDMMRIACFFFEGNADFAYNLLLAARASLSSMTPRLEAIAAQCFATLLFASSSCAALSAPTNASSMMKGLNRIQKMDAAPQKVFYRHVWTVCVSGATVQAQYHFGFHIIFADLARAIIEEQSFPADVLQFGLQALLGLTLRLQLANSDHKLLPGAIAFFSGFRGRLASMVVSPIVKALSRQEQASLAAAVDAMADMPQVLDDVCGAPRLGLTRLQLFSRLVGNSSVQPIAQRSAIILFEDAFHALRAGVSCHNEVGFLCRRLVSIDIQASSVMLEKALIAFAHLTSRPFPGGSDRQIAKLNQQWDQARGGCLELISHLLTNMSLAPLMPFTIATAFERSCLFREQSLLMYFVAVLSDDMLRQDHMGSEIIATALKVIQALMVRSTVDESEAVSSALIQGLRRASRSTHDNVIQKVLSASVFVVSGTESRRRLCFELLGCVIHNNSLGISDSTRPLSARTSDTVPTAKMSGCSLHKDCIPYVETLLLVLGKCIRRSNVTNVENGPCLARPCVASMDQLQPIISWKNLREKTLCSLFSAASEVLHESVSVVKLLTLDTVTTEAQQFMERAVEFAFSLQNSLVSGRVSAKLQNRMKILVFSMKGALVAFQSCGFVSQASDKSKKNFMSLRADNEADVKAYLRTKNSPSYSDDQGGESHKKKHKAAHDWLKEGGDTGFGDDEEEDVLDFIAKE